MLSVNRIWSRRRAVQAAVSSLVVSTLPACGRRGKVPPTLDLLLGELERSVGGRLGVGILTMNSGSVTGYRLDERFAMCSTFKLPLAAIILWQAQNGQLNLDAAVEFSEDDMVPYAPVTEKFLQRGFMSVRELAAATQKTSDNVAANLLLNLIGGPAGFTGHLREMGDEVTRLDRYEPALNFVPEGEQRDTTTPRAMAATVRRVLGSSLLSSEHRDLLRDWMEGTTTGLKRLRAGFPPGWSAGDKTGTAYAPGMANKYNDVAAAWPDDGTPSFVVSAFYEADGEYDEMREQDIAVLKRVGEIVAEAVL